MIGKVIPAPYKYLTLIALTLAVWAHGWVKGAGSVQEEWDRASTDAKLFAGTVRQKQQEVTIQTVTEYVDRVKVVREKADTIVKEVPVYVEVDHCPLSGGFRVLHDAAASNQPPGTTRVADAAAVEAQAAATTIAENYRTCHETAERLTALQGWVRDQRGLIESAEM